MRPGEDAPASPRGPEAHRPWHEVLRALRETRGATQEAWAARLGVSRATVQRWERGERAPDPGAEAAILAHCREAGLLRSFDRGPLGGLTLSEETLRDLFGEARWRGGGQDAAPAPPAGPGAAAGRAQPADLPGMTSSAPSLPTLLTSFVGRQRELAEVRRVQSGTRLLTLTGAGGCGKTRLALALAGELVWAYPHGVWFVDLSPVADAAVLPQAVAAAMGIRPAGQLPPLEALIEHLRGRQALVVADNCEHLLPACTELVETVLRACPRLEVLATSREPLGIAGETVWQVPPLALPEDARPAGDAAGPRSAPWGGDAADGMAALLGSDAVRLFVERARLRRPDFALTAESAAPVVEICRRLDGLPLALELAAARMTVLSTAQIAARLHDRFRLLTDGARTALPRQQTLRATLDWSYDLLTDAERTLLQRLAVFAGGWTLEAAEAVCAGDEIEALEILDRLTSLVEKSLVVVAGCEGEPRYHLLETLREYAREKLAAEDDERDAAHRRHAAYFLALAEAAEPKLQGPEQQSWFVRLEAEHDNLRAALGWAAEAGQTTTGPRLAGALSGFWYIHGFFDEGRRWLERFADAGTRAPAATRAKALQGVVLLAANLADWPAVRAAAEQALALLRELGDWPAYARTLHNLGACVYQMEGDYQAGRALLEEALAVMRQSGDTEGEGQIAVCLCNLGYVTHLLGDTATGRRLVEEALAILRRRAEPAGLAAALTALARFARAEGDTAQARAREAEVLPLCWELRDTRHIALSFANLAGLALGDDPALAARLLGAIEAIAERGGVPAVPERADRAATAEAARRALGDRDFEAAWAAGLSLPLERAVAEALAFATTPPTAPAASRAGNAAGYPHGLTEREVEVLRLVAAGRSNREIADTLVISQNTVLRHVTHILQKTGATNRTEAAVYAQRHGLGG